MCAPGKSTKYFKNSFACRSDATIFFFFFVIVSYIFCIFRSPDIVSTIRENLMKNIALWFDVTRWVTGISLLTLHDKSVLQISQFLLIGIEFVP